MEKLLIEEFRRSKMTSPEEDTFRRVCERRDREEENDGGSKKERGSPAIGKQARTLNYSSGKRNPLMHWLQKMNLDNYTNLESGGNWLRRLDT